MKRAAIERAAERAEDKGGLRARLARWVRALLHQEDVLLGVLAVAVGAVAAYGAIGLRLSADAVAWAFYGVPEEAVPVAVREAGWLVLLIPAFGGLLLGLTVQYVIKRPYQGVADVIEANALRQGRIGLRDTGCSAAVAAWSMGVGASVGREGPIVHLSAGLASQAAQRLKLSVPLVRTLLGCGVAAGVAAAFNAPIAGVFFALEVVIGHYGLGAFSPVVLAAVTGTVVTRVHLGDDPAFVLAAAQEVSSFWELPAFLLLGAMSALAAAALIRGVEAVQDLHERAGVPDWLQPALGGLALGGIAWFYPEVLGVGYEVTSRALAGDLALGALAALALAKLAATALCLGSRFGGGVFSPSLAVGALLGGAFGGLAGGVAERVAPEAAVWLASPPSVYALVGMGAVAGAVLGAPISTVLMVFELTSNYAVTFALMATVAVASLLTRKLFADSFFSRQLTRRGVNLESERELGLLRGRRVAEVMRQGHIEVPVTAGLAELKARFRENPASVFVVDEEGSLVGVIGVDDLAAALLAPEPAEVTAGELASEPPALLQPDDDLAYAWKRLQTRREALTPVVADRNKPKPVGSVRHGDLVLAFNTALLQARAIEQGRSWRRKMERR